MRDEDRFASKAGQEYIKSKNQKNQIRQILAGKGAIFAVFPETGVIDPWSTVEMECYCFNDMCGFFEDRLKCEVKILLFCEPSICIILYVLPVW